MSIAAKSLRWGALRSLAMAFRNATRPGTPGVRARLSALPRLIWATLRGEYAGTSRVRLLALVAGVFYVISPVDLVPELFLPLIGLADDAVVIGWIAVALINDTEAFLSWERERDLARHPDVIVGDIIH